LGLKKYKLHGKLTGKLLFSMSTSLIRGILLNLIRDSTFLFGVVHDVLPGGFYSMGMTNTDGMI